MKVAVSVPDELFDAAEVLGRRLNVTRSRLYATALREYLAKHQASKITERLNAVYDTHDSRLDEVMRRAQARTLLRTDW
jgi:metal-responsive CopG/Arc/MetJ family transcriptional regulator